MTEPITRAQRRAASSRSRWSFFGRRRPADAEGEPRQDRRRAWLITIAALFLPVAIIVASLIKLPYAVLTPGPAYNVLGEIDDGTGKKVNLITITDSASYPNDSGTLDFTTVRVSGGPGYPVSVLDVVAAWIDPRADVYPVEEFFPTEETKEQVKAENTAMMVSSQQVAVGVALEAAGKVVPTLVAAVDPTAPANSVVKPGDRIVSIGGVVIVGPMQAVSVVRAQPPGEKLTLVVHRGGKDITLTTTTRTLASGKAQLGVSLVPEQTKTVAFSVGDIGGPSAGLMFTLGIYDKLTPGPLTGSAKIAGTGTMAPSGDVGPIGGIKQKMAGARDAGADYFLAPADNCDEVVGNEPDGMQVFKVATLNEALTDVKAIAAGQTSGLTRCTLS